MPSPIGHTMINLILYILIGRTKSFFNSWKYLPLSLFVGLFSDTDALFIILGGSIYFHRGMTHSILFAILIALIFSSIFLFKKEISWKKCFLFLSILTLGHLFMDYLTMDELPPPGIKLFWPFISKYYQSPYTIFLSFKWETLEGIFSFATLRAILFEIVVCLPLLLLAIWIRNSKHMMVNNYVYPKN